MCSVVIVVLVLYWLHAKFIQMTIMRYAVTLLALPYAERKTIHHDTLMVDEGMVELEERSL